MTKPKNNVLNNAAKQGSVKTSAKSTENNDKNNTIKNGLGGLKLDEIDATNSFLMLLMARNGLK